MKKTLIKLAVGFFLTALSFMKTEAACAPSPTIVSILPSNTTVTGQRLCAGAIVTISGNFTGTFSGANPYKAVLIMGGSPVSTISGITTSGFKFFYTVPNDGQTGKTVQIQILKYGFYTCNGNSISSAIGQDYSLGTSYLTSPSSSCFDGIGIDMGLDNTDAQPNIIYSLYRSSSFLKTLTCTGMGDPIDFGVQSIVGVYSILGLNTVTGCTRLEGDPGDASSQQYVINSIPSVPIVSYTWCGAGSSLLLYGTSSTTGVTYEWTDITNSLLGSSFQEWTVTSPVAGDTYILVATTSLTGCVSTVLSTPTISYFATPVITALRYYYNTLAGSNATVTGPSGLIKLRELGSDPSWNWTLYCNSDPSTLWYVNPGSGNMTVPGVARGATSISFSSTQNSDATFTIRQSNTACGSVTSSAVQLVFTVAGYICPTCREEAEETISIDVLTLLYPNPANNQLNVNAPFDNYILIIYNLLGSEVFSKQVIAKETQIDLASIPAGIYTIRLIGKDEQITKKFEVVK